MNITTITIIIAELIFFINCAEDDIRPCKHAPKIGIVCDGKAGPITNSVLEWVGSQLVNESFDKIIISNTGLSTIRKNTFGKTIFRAIEISNNTLLESIDENAFEIHDPFWDLEIKNNPLLKTDSMFSLYKALNPVSVYMINQNIVELPENALKIPTPKKSNLGALILSNNKIKIIRKNSFINCPQIRYIELNYNLIETIEDFGFNLSTSSISLNEIRLNGNKLKTNSFKKDTFVLNKLSDKVAFLLHLDSNDLTDLPESVFKPWFAENDHFLYANGNHFNCTCDMKWILHQSQNPSHNKRFNNIFCQNKNKLIELLTDKDFDC